MYDQEGELRIQRKFALCFWEPLFPGTWGSLILHVTPSCRVSQIDFKIHLCQAVHGHLHRFTNAVFWEI